MVRSPLYATIETRWFYEGECPGEVHSWFEETCGSVRAERRIDRYLLLPDSDSLGAKLRGEELLELKLRVGELSPLARHGARGQRERWAKWSLRLADTRVDELLDHPWLAIDKTRWQRRFSVAPVGLRKLRPDPAAGHDACAIELAALEVADERWWSLAFESSGDERRLARTFDSVTGAVLGRRRFPCPLESHRSFGYPRWLHQMAAALGESPEPDGIAAPIAALMRSRLLRS